MKTTLHHFKKDVLRLRVYLLVWFVPLVFELIGLFGGNLVVWLQQTLHLQVPLPGLGFSGLVALIMVPALIHEDSLVDDSAFWLTRPIGRGELLGAKTLFLAGLIAVMTLVKFLLLSQAVLPSQVLAETSAFLLGKIGLLGYAALISSVTLNFKRLLLYALLGPICIVVFASILGAILQGFALADRSVHWRFDATDFFQRLSQEWIILPLLFLCGYGLMGYQYYTRRTKVTLACALGGGVLFILVGRLTGEA
jgi:hypothetical protein